MGEDSRPSHLQHKTKRVFHGVTSPTMSLSIRPSWGAVGLHPPPTTEGSRRGFALCIAPTQSGLAFGEAQSSLLGGRQLQSAGNGTCMPCMGLWEAQLQGDIPKPLGKISFLSERGVKPAPSWSDNVCIEVVKEKAMFLSSGGFLPLRREHEVQHIPQDPDISRLLFPGCSSAWCQCPCVACFPVTFFSCVLGKLVRHERPWGPILCALGSPRRTRQKVTCCAPLALHGPRCVLCSREVVVSSTAGTDGWGGCPKSCHLGDCKEEQGTGFSLQV